MKININRLNKHDRGYLIKTSTLKTKFGLNNTDFDLGREFALTFDINNEKLTMKGSSLRSKGNTVRIGKRAIPEQLLNKFDKKKKFKMNLVDVKKMTTIGRHYQDCTVR